MDRFILGPLKIVIEADVISKKNTTGVTKSGRRYKIPSVVATENIALGQIPPEYYGLKLRHPGMVFWFEVPSKSMSLDRDGLVTTLLDFAVKFGVLFDDNIRNCNGVNVLMPATEAPRKKFTIDIYPDGKIPGVNI